MMHEQVILWVDDDEDDRIIARKAVRHCRPELSITGLSDGEELLQYLRQEGAYAADQPGPLPGIVFLDLHMPRRSGLEVLADLRNDARFHGIPVVVITSTAREEEIEAAIQTGANACLLRPSSFQDLCEALKGALDTWLGADGMPGVAGTSRNEA